jgi:hypothetical protein
LGQISSVDPLAAALVGSDIALAGGVVVMSPAVGAPPLVIGLADAGGVLGGSTAALGAAIASDDPDTIFLASLIGAGVGLAGGTALGIHWHKSDTRRNIAWGLPTLPIPGRFSVSPAQLPGEDAPVLGIRIGLDQW